MTRSERIKKLANAIKAYRGTTVPAPGGKTKWLRAPQLARRSDITRHLLALGCSQDEVELDAMMIDSFNQVSQFEAWIKSLDRKTAKEGMAI